MFYLGVGCIMPSFHWVHIVLIFIDNGGADLLKIEIVMYSCTPLIGQGYNVLQWNGGIM